MGRGRAKAKQTKIARQVKYGNAGADFERLRRELGAAARPSGETADRADESGDRAE
ncbi:DUF3073 family protein [Actinomadura macrotermitis]|uniref:DUF3073 family protein n=1 Tax=Actinomadura macrotermitis TaxID=2585200 RepID=A0A7K0C0L2_9ACTN|nr:hypothetical protein [Actinomadura macrotermitis]